MLYQKSLHIVVQESFLLFNFVIFLSFPSPCLLSDDPDDTGRLDPESTILQAPGNAITACGMPWSDSQTGERVGNGINS